MKDKTPKNDEYVLVNIPYGFMDDTMFENKGSTIITLIYFDNEDGKCWFNDQVGEEQEYSDITHWQPLPEPPQDLPESLKKQAT